MIVQEFMTESNYLRYVMIYANFFGQLPAETIYHDKKLNSFLIDKFLYPILKWKVLT